MSDQQFSVPRNFAADILSVSLRTLDRYAKRNRITSVRRGRQLYFSEEELLRFKAEQMAAESLSASRRAWEEEEEQFRRERAYQLAKPTWAKGRHEFVEVEVAQERERQSRASSGESAESVDLTTENVHIVHALLAKDTLEARMYRNLYQQTQQELGWMKETLYKAQVAIGQMRDKLKGTVPMLMLEQQSQDLRETLAESKQLERQVRKFKTKYALQKQARQTEETALQSRERMTRQQVATMELQVKVEQMSKIFYAAVLFAVAVVVPLVMVVRMMG